MSAPTAELNWELLDNYGNYHVAPTIYRALVFGGWFISWQDINQEYQPPTIHGNTGSQITHYHNKMFFLPDPMHQWDGFVHSKKQLEEVLLPNET